MVNCKEECGNWEHVTACINCKHYYTNEKSCSDLEDLFIPKVLRMLLPYTAEEIEIQLIALFLKHGYSRSAYELVSCWEHTYFPSRLTPLKSVSPQVLGETHVSLLRMQMLLREGLNNIAVTLKEKGFEYAKARRVLLLKSKE